LSSEAAPFGPHYCTSAHEDRTTRERTAALDDAVHQDQLRSIRKDRALRVAGQQSARQRSLTAPNRERPLPIGASDLPSVTCLASTDILNCAIHEQKISTIYPQLAGDAHI